MAKRAIFMVTVAGTNITAPLLPVLQSLTVPDNVGTHSDTAALDIDDTEAVVVALAHAPAGINGSPGRAVDPRRYHGVALAGGALAGHDQRLAGITPEAGGVGLQYIFREQLDLVLPLLVIRLLPVAAQHEASDARHVEAG